VRFLVDAQLPARLCDFLKQHGHDAIHVSILPNGNRLPDATVAGMADDEHRVVVAKDADFRHSHSTIGAPQRLLIVATGNISNHVLLDLIGRRLDDLVAAFGAADFVELRPDLLVVHQRR
jgi:predicted nuclease of predicted toxin-antitoxin system